MLRFFDVIMLMLAVMSLLPNTSVAHVVVTESYSYPPMLDGDIAALELIAQHWPAVVTYGVQPWANVSNPCDGSTANLYGIVCSYNSTSSFIAQLTIDGNFGPENVSDALEPLGQLFSDHLSFLSIANQNLSADTLTSLYMPSIIDLYIINLQSTELGDMDQLQSLQILSINSCPHLQSIPSFPNTTTLFSITIEGAHALSSMGSFPNSTESLLLGDLPLLLSLPSFADLHQLVLVQLESINILELPEFPSPCLLASLTMTKMPRISAFADAALASCPLNSLSIQECSNLTAPPYQLNSSHLTHLALALPMQSLPSWFCSQAHSLSVLRLELSQLAAFPPCLPSFTLLTQFSSSSDTVAASLPTALFQLPRLNLLLVPPAINVSVIGAALRNTPWNLPSLTSLTLPGSFLVNGIPPPGSILGQVGAGLDVLIGSPAYGPMPDSYFSSFGNATTIAPFPGLSCGINGTIPSSVANLTQIRSFSLRGNRLSGSVPISLLTLPFIYRVDLSSNLLDQPLGNMSTILPGWDSFNPPSLNLEDNEFDLCTTWTPDFPNFHTPGWCQLSGLCMGCIAPVYPNCAFDCVSELFNLCGGLPAPSTGVFYCINDIWTAIGSVSSSQPVTITSSVIVQGNLTAPTVVLANVSGTVIVAGCIDTSSVYLNLSQSDLNAIATSSINRTLLVQHGVGCTNLTTLPISINSGSSCTQVSYHYTSENDASTLSVLFTTSTPPNGCGSSVQWWVILVGAVGSFVVLVVVVIVLLVIFAPPVRAFFRPFARRKQNAEPNEARNTIRGKNQIYERSPNAGENDLYEL